MSDKYQIYYKDRIGIEHQSPEFINRKQADEVAQAWHDDTDNGITDVRLVVIHPMADKEWNE